MSRPEGSAVSITSKGFDQTVVVDGVDISRHVTDLRLEMRAGHPSVVEVAFLTAHTFAELGAKPTYVVHAWGQRGSGLSPVGAVEDLLHHLHEADDR